MADKARDPLQLGDLFGAVKQNWGWLLALGIVFIVLGIIGLVMATTLTIVSVLYFGILCLVGGGLQIVQATRCSGWRAILPHVLIALLFIAVGVLIVIDPVLASVSMTLVLGIVIVADGIAHLLMAWQLRRGTNVGLMVLSGLLTAVLGAMIIASWPLSGLTVIGLFVALELIFHGIAYATLALALRNR